MDDVSLALRAGIDDFAAFGERIGYIPVGNRVLAAYAVGYIGIETDGIVPGYSAAELLGR